MSVPNLHATLWAWVQTLPPWQSDLLRRLTTLEEATEDALTDAVSMVAHAFGAETIPAGVEPVPIPALSTPPADSSSTKILSLSDLQAVGSVQPGQTLDFAATGLTIVFGETGAGKSTYTRVLRRACRASDRDVEILPNVLDTAAPAASTATAGTAKISISVGDAVSSISRNVNAAPEAALAQVSVFDADCAVVYADGESEITYTPASLRLFERLVSFQGLIKKRIDEAMSKLEGQQLAIDGFDKLTKAGALVLALNENVNPDTVKGLALVSDEERSRLTDLQSQLAASVTQDPLKTAAELERKAVGVDDLATQIGSIEGTLDLQVVERLLSLNARSSELARQSKDLASSLSTAGARPVGSAAWKALWRAAHDYVSDGDSGEQFPPHSEHADTTCPLCQQHLSPTAIGRLAKLQEFFLGVVERELREVATARNVILQSLRKVSGFSSVSAQAQLLFGDNSLGADTEAFIKSASTRNSAIQASASALVIEAPSLATSPMKELQSCAKDLRRRASEQRALAKPEILAKSRAETAELHDRLRLGERLDQVVARIKALRQIAKLKAASSGLTTTGLSKKIGEFTDGAVTAQLRTRLGVELQALHVDHLPIAIGARGTKGKTQVSLRLDANRKVTVGQVLSTGEQRAAALAFFLAEVAVAEHAGGIVLDDPVSSLDHGRRSYVADRLVEQSAKRQVIVFTHDVVLFLELQSLAARKNTPCEVRVVRRVGDTAGVTTKDIPWVAQNVGQRIKYLRNELQALGAIERKGDADRYRREVKIWFELLREAWERSVEEKLFGGVVGRFQPSINTLSLKRVLITKEMTDAVEKGMTDASNWTHDQAAALNKPPPTTAQLTAALADLEAFVGKFKSNRE